MNFKIGDKVRFLNEKGEGIVSKIINKTTLGITIEAGFEIPYVISELVLIRDETKIQNPVESIFQPPIQPEALRKKAFKNEEQEGIYLAFSPEKINELASSDFNVWLINHTSYKIIFTYSITQNGNFITIETGELQAYESLLIETIDKSALGDFSNFKIEVLFFDKKEHTPQSPVSELIKLRPIKLYKENAFTENSFISEKALIINVSRLNDHNESETEQVLKNNIDLSKILFQKQTFTDVPKKSKPHAANNGLLEMEVDLHIEELLDNYSRMSNAEIIQVQLRHLKSALDKAISGNYRKLIVIHGVGNGRLKQEVGKILSTFDNIHFYDGSYSKYGFGATEVVIG